MSNHFSPISLISPWDKRANLQRETNHRQGPALGEFGYGKSEGTEADPTATHPHCALKLQRPWYAGEGFSCSLGSPLRCHWTRGKEGHAHNPALPKSDAEAESRAQVALAATNNLE